MGPAVARLGSPAVGLGAAEGRLAAGAGLTGGGLIVADVRRAVEVTGGGTDAGSPVSSSDGAVAISSLVSMASGAVLAAGSSLLAGAVLAVGR